MPWHKGYIARWFTSIAHNFRTTSPYGPRGDNFHRGIDFGGPGVRGTPVSCPWHGTVSHSGYDSSSRGYGHYVGVKMDCGHTMVFAHLDRRDVAVGQWVYRGRTVGLLGNTGFSTGPHLHFQINRPGTGVRGSGYWGDPDEFVFSSLAPGRYRVQPGDVLWRIARHNGVDWGQLMEWNEKLADPSLLQVGWELQVSPPQPRILSLAAVAREVTRLLGQILEKILPGKNTGSGAGRQE